MTKKITQIEATKWGEKIQKMGEVLLLSANENEGEKKTSRKVISLFVSQIKL